MTIICHVSIISLSLHFGMSGWFRSLLISRWLIHYFLSSYNLHLFIFGSNWHWLTTTSGSPVHLKIYVILAFVLLHILVDILLGVLAHLGPRNIRWVRNRTLKLDIIKIDNISRDLAINLVFTIGLIAWGELRTLFSINVVDLRILPLQAIGSRILSAHL